MAPRFYRLKNPKIQLNPIIERLLKYKSPKTLCYRLVVLVLLMFSVYHYVNYILEQRYLDKKAHEIIAIANAQTQTEQILALRDYVRLNVTSAGLNLNDKRPFLRDSAKRTLETGKGFCGEVSRTFICLARQLGINAQRINLYGKNPHVVAVVELDTGERFLVDSQRAPDGTTVFDEPITLNQLMSDPKYGYTNYSTIHLRRLGLGNFFTSLNLRITFISWLLENPSLLLATLALGGTVALVVVKNTIFLLMKMHIRHIKRNYHIIDKNTGTEV